MKNHHKNKKSIKKYNKDDGKYKNKLLVYFLIDVIIIL